jgi:hypothetical protein
MLVSEVKMTSKGFWPMEVITQVYPGKDGIVRFVEVRIQAPGKKKSWNYYWLKRAPRSLCPLL